MSDTATNIQAAIQAGKDQIEMVQVDGYRAVIVHPATAEVAELTREKLEKPRFLTASPLIHDAKAFVDYVNAFKEDASRIFYAQDGKFLAVIDYHDAAHGPRHGDHVVALELKRSPEWALWAGKNQQSMGQQEFAEFLEDNAQDILKPDPAVMLEVATGLQATVGANFKRAYNQSNGQIKVLWDENIEAKVSGSDAEIPQTFTIGLRPFMGCHRYQIECRLRFRISNGNLNFHFKALRLEQVTEDALEAVVNRIDTDTGITPALGSAKVEVFAKGM